MRVRIAGKWETFTRVLAIALRLEKWHLLSRKDKKGQFVYTVDHANENSFDCRVSNLEVLGGCGVGRGVGRTEPSHHRSCSFLVARMRLGCLNPSHVQQSPPLTRLPVQPPLPPPPGAAHGIGAPRGDSDEATKHPEVPGAQGAAPARSPGPGRVMRSGIGASLCFPCMLGL